MKTHQFNPGRGWLLLAAVVGFFTLASSQAADLSGSQGRFLLTDYKFAAAAARGGTMEVTLGKLALLKSTDDGVKQFGSRMAKNHDQAGKELEAIAERKGAVLTTQPTMQQQRDMDFLNGLNGTDFDKAYIHLMVRNHQEDLRDFKNAAQSVEDSDLKSFAKSMVPIIEEHLKLAQDLENNMKTLSATK